ncbi:MAG: hypothetical protein NZX77_05065 [Polyangiaceae bacterium]|nr:hypothetical protein [Polyangiaceae bacterium]
MPVHPEQRGVIPGSLGAIVRAFKAACASRYRRENAGKGSIRQRNYHDPIIRDPEELDRVRLYITENPSRWLRRQHDPSSTFASGRPW